MPHSFKIIFAAFVLTSFVTSAQASVAMPKVTKSEAELMGAYKIAKESNDKGALEKASTEIARYCLQTAGQYPYAGMGPSPTTLCIARLKGMKRVAPQVGALSAAP